MHFILICVHIILG